MFKEIAGKGIRGMALGLAIAAGAVVASPGDVAAAGTGTWAPASVRCDAFTNQLVLTPFAGAMNGYNSQTIYFRYWVYNRSTGKYLWNGNSTSWGSLVHTAFANVAINPFVPGGNGTMTTPGPVAGPSLTLNLPDGVYQVYTQYAWNNGGWDYAAGWSNQFAQPYMSTFYRDSSCRI